MSDVIAIETKRRAIPVTDGIYADLAEAIIEAHNAEGRELTAVSFVRATARLDLQQRYAVGLELPPWAQRKINFWGDSA